MLNRVFVGQPCQMTVNTSNNEFHIMTVMNAHCYTAKESKGFSSGLPDKIGRQYRFQTTEITINECLFKKDLNAPKEANTFLHKYTFQGIS